VAFNIVEVGPGSALTFDATHAMGPGLAAKHIISSASDASYGWTGAFGEHDVWYGRTYVWVDRFRCEVRLVGATDDGRSSMAIDIAKTGRIRIRDAALRNVGTSAGLIATRGWVRIEWKVDHAAGIVEVRLFNNATATVPTETFATSPGRSIGARTDGVVFGLPVGGGGTAIFWTDDTAVSWSGYLGRS
jgi:hypothetical protein